MSLSKLESLPNEILSDLLEKYINGVDILMGFNYQLNRRFNGLINQSQRLRFNFFGCHKNELRFCLGLLPAYLVSIEELAISDHDAPGQVHAFLSSFPSFGDFQYLRRLYFHFNNATTDWNLIENAFDSLSNTMIDTLSIEATYLENKHSMIEILRDVFRLKSLKRLSLRSDVLVFNWNELAHISSNIEHLTIIGLSCGFEHLQYIFQCAPHLKYLSIRTVSHRSSFNYESEKDRKKNIIPMSELRTLILSFKRLDPTAFEELRDYLVAMPVLNRLEINAYNQFLHAHAWEMLFKSSLPLLTHFTLRTTTADFIECHLQDVLTEFQNLFWKSKNNFNLIVTEYKSSDLISDGQFRLPSPSQHKFDLPIIRYWTAPDRTANDNYMIMDKITSFRLCHSTDVSSRSYYFDNVKYVEVDRISTRLFQWFIPFVNCSHITELVITDSLHQIEALISLLACVTNLKSLCIPFALMTATKDAFLGKTNRLKRLDISSPEHTFNGDNIRLIAKLFPHIEHLKISTTELYNVPLLKRYTPYLRSLTFTIKAHRVFAPDEYTTKQREFELRAQTTFLLHIHENSITVWIDQAALEDPYWQTYIRKTSPPMEVPTSSITSRSESAIKKNISSFLKRFK